MPAKDLYHNNCKNALIIDLEIINGKIWVQQDGTEYGIARELLEAGIPKERIVLGFKEPKVKPYTGFAVV